MFSQNNEEKLIADYFGGYVGTLLSLGENDGTHLSNIRALLEGGWSGVVVEPSPLPFACLCTLYLHRDDVFCFKVAVSNFCGKVMMYDSGTHLQKGDTGLLSSLHKSETMKWRKTTEFKEVEVDVVDFKTLLKMSPYKTFDFINVDVEGNDLVVLRQMDLRKLEVKLYCIEYNSVRENFIAIDKIFSAQGYELLHRNAENLIYSII